MNKISAILSKVQSLFSKFKKAKKVVEQQSAPVSQPAPSNRVRARSSSAVKAVAKAQPAAAPVVAKPAKKLLVKLPSLKLGVRLDLGKIRSAISGLAVSSIRSASKKEIEGFYSTKNYRAVLLSIASDRTEENFLAVKRELKAQDVLMSRFPGKIMKSAKLQGRRSMVESELNKLELELSSKSPTRRQGSDLKSRISALDGQVAVFRDIKKLVK